jgi:serine protease Do
VSGGVSRMKFVATLALASALFAQGDVAWGQIDRSRMLYVAPSVLKIEAVSPEGRYQLGSGVIVAPGKVVTNCHVTRHAERIDVVRAGVRWRVASQAADLLRDLCVLRVPRLEGEPVAMGKAGALKAAQDVMAIGYTGGVGVQLSEGDVVALHTWSGGHIVQSSNWFSSGASGGGLFNADGALVGILTFRLRGGAKHLSLIHI